MTKPGERPLFSAAGLAHLGWWIILVNAAASLVLGLLAALAGGPLTRLGDGLGGGYGIPELFFLLPVLLGLPGLWRGLKGLLKGDRKQTRWLLVFVGPLLISMAYVQLAHALDPCFNGIWDLSSRTAAGAPLCERFGPEINIHTRFHYIWHIFWSLPIVALYGYGLKKRLPEVW